MFIYVKHPPLEDSLFVFFLPACGMFLVGQDMSR